MKTGKITRCPDHCKGCLHHYVAGHPKGSRLANSKHQNWCCHFGTWAPKAVSKCIQQNAKRMEVDNDRLANP